jgi:hypothetical protein
VKQITPIIALILSATTAIADRAQEEALEEQHEPDPVVVPELPDPKPLHPSLWMPQENRAAIQQLRNGLAEARAQAARATNTANIALGLSVLQMDLSRDNYIGGGLAFYDGETVGTIGYSRSIGSADLGLMISTDGNETAVGVFGGWGW